VTMTKEEWELETTRLGVALKERSKAKEYAKEIDGFLRTSKVNPCDARVIAISGGVKMILRDIGNLMEARHITLQRGMDAIIREAGDKWKSVVRNSTELKVLESDALLLLVGTCGVIHPELGKMMAEQFHVKVVD